MDIQGKVAIITGASAGIGLVTARLFAAQGAKVVLAARSADKLAELAADLTAQGYDALAVPTDVCQPDAVKQLIEATLAHYGQLDILINNAGQGVAGTIEKVSIDDYRQIIELNLFGPLYAMQAAIPVMRQAGGGLILNISSMVSKMQIPGLAGYASTKSALNMLSATARGELAADNIRVITVYPRLTATDFGKNYLGNSQTRPPQRANMPTPDSAELVAEKILEAVRKEPAEQFMDS
jgi:short-subunit dehydrogenase